MSDHGERNVLPFPKGEKWKNPLLSWSTKDGRGFDYGDGTTLQIYLDGTMHVTEAISEFVSETYQIDKNGNRIYQTQQRRNEDTVNE